MENRVISVFYGQDMLPYKDSDRTIHYPVTSSTFAGSNNVSEIHLYVDQIGGTDNISWVIVSKLPNGKLGYEPITTLGYDDELDVYYLVFTLSSYYTQAKGVLKLALRGYSGTITFEQVNGVYQISGDPSIEVTGTIDFAINYSPFVDKTTSMGQDEYLLFINALANYIPKINGVVVLDDISNTDLSDYLNGQIIYDKATRQYYLYNGSSYSIYDNGFVKILHETITATDTIASIQTKCSNGTCVLTYANGLKYLVSFSTIFDGQVTTITAIELHSLARYYSFDGELAFTNTFASLLTNTYKNSIVLNSVLYSDFYTKTQANTLLDNKVDKTSTGSQVYGTSSNGSQTTIDYDTFVSGPIVRRVDSNSGNIYVGTPTASNHATPKSYVDNKVAALGTVLNYKGSKTVAQLNALTGQVAGDVYNVTDVGTLSAGSVEVLTGDNVVWTSNSVWDKLSTDLDGFMPTTEAYSSFASFKRETTTISFTQGNKGVWSENTDTNRITIANKDIVLIKNVKIEAKSGTNYQFCVYSLNGTQLTNGWVTSFTPTINYKGDEIFFVFRESSNADITAGSVSITSLLEDETIIYPTKIEDVFSEEEAIKKWSIANLCSYEKEEEELEFIQGNVFAGSSSSNRVSILGARTLLKGETIETNNGYEMAVYRLSASSSPTALTSGFVTQYTSAKTEELGFCFKLSNDGNLSAETSVSTVVKDISVLQKTLISYAFVEKYIKWKYTQLSSVVVVQGNKGVSSSNVQANRASIVLNGSIKKGQYIKAKSGFLVAIYGTNSILTGGWVSKYAFLNDVSYLVIAFKKEDGSNFDANDYDVDDLLENTEFVCVKEIENAYLDYGKLINIPETVKKWSGKTATFMGDSITAGLGATSGQLYWNKLKEKLDLASVTGMGVAGSCLSVTSNYGTDNSPISQRWNTIPNSDLIVIFAGTNDYGHDTPMGTISDVTDISFYGALNVVISGLMSTYPTKRIVFMTPLHRYNFGGLTYDYVANGAGNTLKDYVDAIKAVCERYGIPVIDTFSISGLNPVIESIKTTYMTDGLHPNDDGHSLIAERTFGLFEDL